MLVDLSMEEERLALLARFRAQRESLAEQIAEATKFLAETDRQIAELERGRAGLLKPALT